MTLTAGSSAVGGRGMRGGNHFETRIAALGVAAAWNARAKAKGRQRTEAATK